MTKIGLIGFFGAGAYSDDLIGYVTKQLLLGERPGIQFDSNLTQKCARGTAPKLLNQLDLIIHAGGSLLGKCEHAPILDIHKWHSRVLTPMTIFGTGYRYEPDKEPLNRIRKQRLQILFKKAKVISVRGYRTTHHLKRNGIDTSKIISVGDPVMACDIKLKREPTHIMGNVRNLQSSEIKHVPNEKVQAFMAQAYDWLIDYYDLPLMLVSFRHKRKDNDILGARRTQARMRHTDRVTICAPKNFMEAVQLMRHAKFWFGQRLHPTLFAGVQGIPFIGLEYQFEKMIDWVGTVDINNYIDTRHATLDLFVKKFYGVSKNMKTLKHNLPPKIKEIQAVAKRIVELV